MPGVLFASVTELFLSKSEKHLDILKAFLVRYVSAFSSDSTAGTKGRAAKGTKFPIVGHSFIAEMLVTFTSFISTDEELEKRSIRPLRKKRLGRRKGAAPVCDQ